MKRSRKSMLLSSLAMLMVSTIALSTATYAWFTSGDTAKVGNFDFQAQTASGIQISADGNSWGSALTLDNLSVQTLGNKFPTADTKWEPVSSAGGVSSGALQLFTATLGNGTISSAAATGEESYIKFNFYVKNSGTTQVPFNLDFATGNQSEVKAVANESDKGIQNAVRIAFIKQDSKTVGSSNPLNGTSGTSAWIWEPNATKHKNATWGSASVDTYGIKAVTQQAVSSVDNRFGSTATDYVAKQDTNAGFHQATSKTEITTLKPNSITLFTAYIWLEGQDVDCTNYESGGTVSVNLAFCGATGTAGGSESGENNGAENQGT